MKFKTIYIDFPWEYNKRNNASTKFGTGMHKYRGMPIQEIISLGEDINSVCEEDCAILAWATGAKMDQFFQWATAMKKFGFRYCTKPYTWLKVSKEGKPRALPGFYTLSNVEDVFLLARGSVKVHTKGEKQVFLDEISTEILEEVCLQPHSRKPEIFKGKIVKTFGDVSRLEIFSRADKKLDDDGWINVGNEVGETLGMDVREALKLIRENKYI
jgi:N6-adenosine-specific RNA methylase IME4